MLAIYCKPDFRTGGAMKATDKSNQARQAVNKPFEMVTRQTQKGFYKGQLISKANSTVFI